MRNKIAAVWLLCAAAIPARGEIMVGNSLEWLTARADAIAVVEITMATGDPTGNWSEWITLSAKPWTLLKGSFPDKLTFDWYQGRNSSKAEKGDLFLLFFNGEEKVYEAIRLTPPDATGPNAPYTFDFKVLSSRQEIISTVTKCLAFLKLQHPAGAILVEVPESAPAFKALWSGSSVFLRVPADPQWKDYSLADLKSKDWQKRQRGAGRLRLFPGPDTVAALNPLLTDPATQEVTSFSSATSSTTYTIYPVRQTAYRVLKMWNQKVPEPEGYRADAPSFLLE